MEALDAAAVEAALSLCEEAVSEGHTLPGPWETQELKPSEPTLAVQDSVCTQEPQDPVSMSDPSPVGLETHGQPDVKKEEQFTGNCDGSEVTGADVAPFGVSDDGAAGSEVTEDAAAVKEATEVAVKSEGEDWSQPEPNPPCLGKGGTSETCTTFQTKELCHINLFLCFFSVFVTSKLKQLKILINPRQSVNPSVTGTRSPNLQNLRNDFIFYLCVC